MDYYENLKMLNLETKEQKDMNIAKCGYIFSFEDKVLTQDL